MWMFARLGITSALIVFASVGTAQADCRSGFVWRDAKDGDGVCVTPDERDIAKKQNANARNNRAEGGGNTCRSGYVWREAWVGDTVCVTPTERAAAKSQNANGPQNAR
jgi:hypothetical protein